MAHLINPISANCPEIEGIADDLARPATYFVQPKHGGPVKIGRGRGDCGDRVAELQTAHWDELVILLILDGDVERILHGRFSKHRIRGEWFDPAPCIAYFIESYYQPESQIPLRGWTLPPDIISGASRFPCDACRIAAVKTRLHERLSRNLRSYRKAGVL